jgi:Opioid growth factor receptor (OGFr) conserved region
MRHRIPSSEILTFYAGTSADPAGRRLPEIQQWPDPLLEANHDFIQWMFPIMEPSSVHPEAPVLDQETIRAFKARPELQQNLRSSFLRMLAFYGFELEMQKGLDVRRSSGFADQSSEWLWPGNHNHLRITRIIKSLRLLGLEAEAKAFFKCLSELYAEETGRGIPRITATTFQFWSSAAEDPRIATGKADIGRGAKS